jgi:hypothetical protein
VLRSPEASRSASIRSLVLASLVLAAALARLLPHPPNLTPLGALALFGGAHFATRRSALAVPLAAMVLTDVLYFRLEGWELGPMRLVVYGCLAAVVLLGRRLRGDVRPARVAGASLASALLFFGVTNFAVWIGGETYPATGAGLAACYLAALPFFGNTLAGHALFGLALFGGFALLERRFPPLAASSLPDPGSAAAP